MGWPTSGVRRTPANQAHVTNWREHPALLAYAPPRRRGAVSLAEVTTVRVARNAPFNARAGHPGRFPGGRGGVLTRHRAVHMRSVCAWPQRG
ncbi:MAG: propanediol/glycerol family dehydratase large subunit [Caldilineaceae bacterium]